MDLSGGQKVYCQHISLPKIFHSSFQLRIQLFSLQIVVTIINNNDHCNDLCYFQIPLLFYLIKTQYQVQFIFIYQISNIMQGHIECSSQFYFPSTQEIQEFQTITFALNSQTSQQNQQNCDIAQKFEKFNNLLNTIRQTNQELDQTVGQQNLINSSKNELILTKLKMNLKDFALTEQQLNYLIVLEKRYHQIRNKKNSAKQEQGKKKNMVEVRKHSKKQHHDQNPRKFKVKW